MGRAVFTARLVVAVVVCCSRLLRVFQPDRTPLSLVGAGLAETMRALGLRTASLLRLHHARRRADSGATSAPAVMRVEVGGHPAFRPALARRHGTLAGMATMMMLAAAVVLVIVALMLMIEDGG